MTNLSPPFSTLLKDSSPLRVPFHASPRFLLVSPKHFFCACARDAGQARDRKEPLSKISPHLEDLLSEFHVRNGTETDTQDNSSTSDADASGDTHVGGSHVEAARKTSSVFPLLHNATLDHKVSQHIIKLKKINLKPNIKDEALSGSNTRRDSDGDHLTENHVMLCTKDPWASNPSCALHVGDTLRGPLRSAAGGSVLWPRADGSLMFGKYQEAPSTEGGVRGEGAGPKAMRFITLLQSDSNVVRSVIGMRRSKVRVFRGKGDNEPGRKMGMVRGSVPLVQRLEKSSMNDIGTVTDVPEADKRQDSEGRIRTAGGWLPSAVRVEKTNLVETGTPTDDVGSVTEVKWDVWGIQTTKVHDVGGQGNDDDLGIKKGTTGGWLPWARRDEKNRLNEIGTAADKTGEVCASVSNKGCVVSRL